MEIPERAQHPREQCGKKMSVCRADPKAAERPLGASLRWGAPFQFCCLALTRLAVLSSWCRCTGCWPHKSIWRRGEGLNSNSVPGFGTVPTQRQSSFLSPQHGSWTDSGPSSGAPCFLRWSSVRISAFSISGIPSASLQLPLNL